jgi:hypothetical protein
LPSNVGRNKPRAVSAALVGQDLSWRNLPGQVLAYQIIEIALVRCQATR